MSEYRIQSETLEAIGDAIRSKTGGSALINPEDMADEISSISGGGSLPSGGGDYSKLVSGTYGNIVVDSDGVLTCSTTVTAYALPLTKPIQINSGDVIKIAMLTTVRAYHVWRLMNGTTELQMKQTANFESPYITSITADFTGTVDNIKLAINPSASGATVKFAWFINNKIVLG